MPQTLRLGNTSSWEQLCSGGQLRDAGSREFVKSLKFVSGSQRKKSAQFHCTKYDMTDKDRAAVKLGVCLHLPLAKKTPIERKPPKQEVPVLTQNRTLPN